MDARRFFFLSAGTCLLTVAYALGALNARANVIVPGSGPIAAVAGYDVLRADGTCWALVPNRGVWERRPEAEPLPVPVSEIAFWEFDHLYTTTGVIWWINTSSEPWHWVQGPQIPLPAVGTNAQAWTAVKNRYRK